MSDTEHVWIPKLKQQLAEKKIDRREFIRYSTLLGVSSGAAYMWAGKITGNPISEPVHAGNLPMGGSIRIAMRVPKIDTPPTFAWVYDSNIVRQVCGYMTRTGADNVTRPDLCSKWRTSEDLKTWTFTISDATWRKGGPFTAEQAAWNIKHCLDPKVGSSIVGLMKGYMLNEIDTGAKDENGNPVMTTELWDANAIEVKDDKTLVLNL
jgi:peptide/nickel transport system substrate-binding protein